MDGVEDCLLGEDETNIWSSCGAGGTFRYVPDSQNSSCEEVYLCGGEFVKFENLCDGKIDSCPKENAVCSISRGVIETYDIPLSAADTYVHPFCAPGLSNLQGHLGIRCEETIFHHPPLEIFGRNRTLKVVMPNNY